MSRYDVLFMNGKSLMFWALEWFSMSNDAFFACYGFNFNPHNYPGHHEACHCLQRGEARRDFAGLDKD